MRALILGSRSDIAMGLRPLMEADGWWVTGWHRGHRTMRIVARNHGPYTRKTNRPGYPKRPTTGWDLAIVAIGTVAPVGDWHTHSTIAWEQSIKSNLLLPLRLLRANWRYHNPGASICFLAGSNPNMIMRGYSAYNVGKMAVLKAVEQLDFETPDAKFFALAPGIVNTKIHQPTLKADWPNPKLAAALDEGRSTPIPRIYECLKWCIAQDKEVIGGRNICVSDDWDIPNHGLQHHLKDDANLFKLRRYESR